MPQTLVFATTLTSHDTPIGELAARWAARRGATLRLVHVCEDARAPALLGTREEALLGDVRARLDAEAARLRTLTAATVEPHLAAGAPVPALAEVVALEQAELLLLGDVREGGHLLSPTATRASRAVPAPVLMLRAHQRVAAWLDGARPLRVLVGIDPGLAADAACAWTAQLTGLGPCEVHLVHLCVPAQVHERLHLPPPREEGSLGDDARLALERELDRRGPVPAGWTRSVVATTDTAEVALVSLATGEDVDLVVVGQRPKSWFDRLWAGSVSDALLRNCPVSLATIPPVSSAEVAPAPPPRVILTAVDFSPAAIGALRQASGLVPPGGVLHLVHVLPPASSSTALVHERAEAWRRLTGLPFEERDGKTVQHHLVEGDAAAQVLALAARCGAELIVLGTSQQGLAGLLGSVSRSVSEQARVPVLLVPASPP